MNNEKIIEQKHGNPSIEAFNLSFGEIMQIGLSGLCGSVICLIATNIVNFLLVEISYNALFAFYLGFFLLSLSAYLLVRIDDLVSNTNIKKFQVSLFIAASLVVVSGFSMFLLDEKWFIGLNFAIKAPFYSYIAMSLNFAIIFLMIDNFSSFFGLFSATKKRTLFENPKQIQWLLLLSLCMGAFFGLVFGIFDLEDQVVGDKKHLSLAKEDYYCMPIAIMLGFCFSSSNEFLRLKSSAANNQKPSAQKFEEVYHDNYL